MVGRQSVFVAQENSKSRFGNEKASCCDHIEISIGNLSTLRGTDRKPHQTELFNPRQVKKVIISLPA